MRKVFNFAAGPSMLPEEVLIKAQKELLDYRGTGMSVMELSHRSGYFHDIISEAESRLRNIMTIPDSYKVLFLQGGASTQFAMIPYNLFSQHRKADYVDTGNWSKKAITEAQRYGNVRVAASSADKDYTYIPKTDSHIFDPEADYVHITTNNTIYGTKFTAIPETGSVPLVADMSSNILSEQIDVSQFGLIYAGAQKNIAPAGLTLVIIREDLVGHPLAQTPTMLNYATHAEKHSLFNTPPCFCIYMALLVFQWILDNGGLSSIEARNREKAALLYDYIDNSRLFRGTAEPHDRSIMNVTFIIEDETLLEVFLQEAEKQNLVFLKGHRSVGGLRASMYNAMPLEGVKILVTFMQEFEKDRT
jgi:phosphoserine aminotransferase